MKSIFSFIPFKFLSITVVLLLFFSITLNAQEESKKENEEVKIEKIAFSINDISVESERINKQLSSYKDILVPSGTVVEVDSLLIIIYKEIQLDRDTLLLELDIISRRNLKIRQVKWKNYRSVLKELQKGLNDRIVEVSDISNEIILEIDKWEFTKDELNKNSSSKSIFENLDGIITILTEVLDIATLRLEAIYSIEKKLTEIILINDEVIAKLDEVELAFKKDYFIFDSNPIWSVKDSLITAHTANLELEKKSFIEQVIANKNVIIDFYKTNAKVALIQALFILLIFLLLMNVKKRWIVKLKDLSNPVEIQSKIILKNPFASTAIVGVLVSAFFYEALIPNVIEFFVLIILFGVIRILPKLTNQKIRVYLIGILLVYLISIVTTYLELNSFLSRIVLMLQIGIFYLIIRNSKKLIKENIDDFVRIYKVYKYVAPFYMLLLIVAFFANVIGMVGLSRFLFNGVQSSIILLMVLYTSVKIITSIIVLLFKLRKKFEMKAVTTIVDATHKRFQPILFWAGMMVWLLFTVKGFEVLDFIETWVDNSLHFTWKLGETIISLGGILSFLIIFTITILIAKLVASIFQDDWMVSILPRGIAPGISLTLRILLISIGFYIGVSSAGIDLSKLGFIIGALGVGIGFGLQNVVLNFIAGLILAFERPINIGDTIEVDNEFGIVTNIGIRSSNIKTYDGYEAIIPNGDLISKKVVNWTLSDRDRKSKVLFKTSANINPEDILILSNTIGVAHVNIYKDPEPFTYFKGYDEDGNLKFELWYWTTFSNALISKHDISLKIFAKLREIGVAPPIPNRRIIE